jgi:hypothetical protein
MLEKTKAEEPVIETADAEETPNAAAEETPKDKSSSTE